MLALLIKPVRDRAGKSHFREHVLILGRLSRSTYDQDSRVLIKVQFEDGSEGMCFYGEIEEGE